MNARPILVAWNLTLDRDDPALARDLARQVRASAPGGLPGVRAIGWSIAEYGRSQVSTNIVDWQGTSPHALTAAVRRLAAAAGARVVGAGLIGLDAEAALLADDGLESRPTAERLSAAVETLGLDHLGPITLDAVVLERAVLEPGAAPLRPSAQERDGQPPGPGLIPVLPEEEALPRAEVEAPTRDGDEDRGGRRNAALDVRGHVVRALLDVAPEESAIRREPAQEGLGSPSTSGPAFSWITRLAEVWWMKTWARPSAIGAASAARARCRGAPRRAGGG